MEKIWVLITAIVLLFFYAFLLWRLTSGDTKKEYGSKMWKHWPTRLYFWQGIILYSVGFTIITMFLLKWGNILTF
jgi:Flp pilus assembly protein protease CpaA